MVYTPSPATAAFALLTLGALSTVNAAAIPAFRGLSGTPAVSTGAPLTPGIGLAHSSSHMNASESEHRHGTTAAPTTPVAPAPDSFPVQTPSEINTPQSGDHHKHVGVPEGKHAHGKGKGKNLESASSTMKKGSHRAKSSTSDPTSNVDPAAGNTASQSSSDLTGSPGSAKGLDGMKQRRSFKSVMSDIDTGVKDVGNDVGGLVSSFLKREEFEEV
ncbi:uncharacterized protein C8R40DRAFT_479486 [Lentinula edodes]|uniref:uncharacterized protein n=1 Tax=Lentinula edodes TaxID=5353 RepID=UPI001E8E834E|nr:uncharacterized protein C8R40DRAFT_479486 [Lentinula edodes]KAH7872674.1 hypothetical protein C8R40DRAFT_479486 [Lentinula edodes]